MIRGNRLAAIISLVKAAHTLEDLSEIEERVIKEGIEDLNNDYEKAFLARLDCFAKNERANGQA